MLLAKVNTVEGELFGLGEFIGSVIAGTVASITVIGVMLRDKRVLLGSVEAIVLLDNMSETDIAERLVVC